MSFGAISASAVRALSRGAARAGCRMDTGEGGLSPYHLEGNCDVIMQVTSARAHGRCASARISSTPRTASCLLRCIEALRCHTNTCPTGVTTHNKRLQCGLAVEEKYLRRANYCQNMNKEIDMIAHSCGCRHARELKREHVRIVQSPNQNIALNMLYPPSDARYAPGRGGRRIECDGGMKALLLRARGEVDRRFRDHVAQQVTVPRSLSV